MTFSLVYGPSHVVDHRETADGLQEMIIWPTENRYNSFVWNLISYCSLYSKPYK